MEEPKELPGKDSHPANKKYCLECAKEIVGRLDKKFCDAYCRNTFNNKVKRQDEQYIQKINSIMRSNRRILKTLSPEGKASVRKDVLKKMGYDFRYYSATYQSPKLLYYICYDYGFAAINDNGKQKAMIIQKQNYMDDYEIDPWTK